MVRSPGTAPTVSCKVWSWVGWDSLACVWQLAVCPLASGAAGPDLSSARRLQRDSKRDRSGQGPLRLRLEPAHHHCYHLILARVPRPVLIQGQENRPHSFDERRREVALQRGTDPGRVEHRTLATFQPAIQTGLWKAEHPSKGVLMRPEAVKPLCSRSPLSHPYLQWEGALQLCVLTPSPRSTDSPSR